MPAASNQYDVAGAALGSGLRELLRCPSCASPTLEWARDDVRCASCSTVFPVQRGVPVLVDDDASVFSRSGVATGQQSFFRAKSAALRALDRLTPRLAYNVAAPRNFQRLSELLPQGSTVLVVGGALAGAGSRAILDRTDIRLVETDVSIGPRTNLVCDAHDLPLADGSVDAVVAQAVLEHVIDPARCVAEIHRVLRPGGWVYAEIPFMQPVHGGAYDFTRFSRGGLLHLFRGFSAVDVGVACGPASAVAYAVVYFVRAATPGRRAARVASRLARVVLSPLKYLDVFLARSERSLDVASSLYFLGTKRDVSIAPREIVAAYKGGAR